MIVKVFVIIIFHEYCGKWKYVQWWESTNSSLRLIILETKHSVIKKMRAERMKRVKKQRLPVFCWIFINYLRLLFYFLKKYIKKTLYFSFFCCLISIWNCSLSSNHFRPFSIKKIITGKKSTFSIRKWIFLFLRASEALFCIFVGTFIEMFKTRWGFYGVNLINLIFLISFYNFVGSITEKLRNE